MFSIQKRKVIGHENKFKWINPKTEEIETYVEHINIFNSLLPGIESKIL